MNVAEVEVAEEVDSVMADAVVEVWVIENQEKVTGPVMGKWMYYITLYYKVY
jgi:hypothetical protein